MNKKICPYKEKDKTFSHVFFYGSKKPLCDNLDCKYNFGKFQVEGEGGFVGVCRTRGYILLGKQNPIKNIEEEKKKEAGDLINLIADDNITPETLQESRLSEVVSS